MEADDGSKFRIQGWSLVPLRMELLGVEGTLLASATAFCTVCEEQTFLVSAWHCLSGRDPSRDNQPIHGKGALPQKIRVLLPSKKAGDWGVFESPLCTEDRVSLWIEHPQHGSSVDLAALPIQYDERYRPRTVEAKENVTDILLFPSLDVFVLGYPLGLTAEGPLAVWKRATIASEPTLNPEGLPYFLIDTTSTRGMSGSPVIVRTANAYQNEQRKHVKKFGTVSQFVGVYSGRRKGSVVPDQRDEERQLDAQLGIVWKRSALDEILSNPMPASYFH